MSTTSPEVLNEVRRIVCNFPEGVSASQVANYISPPQSLRNVQRWLRELIEDGKIAQQGQGPQTRYIAATPCPDDPPTRGPVDQRPGLPVVSANPPPSDVSSPPSGTPAPGASDTLGASAPKPTPPPPGAVEATFESLSTACILNAIALCLSRPAAIAVLQNVAIQNLSSASDRGTFVRDTVKRLDDLTADDAVKLGALPELYQTWRTKYLGQATIDPSTRGPVDQRPSGPAPAKADAEPSRKPHHEPTHAPISEQKTTPALPTRDPTADLAAAMEALAPIIKAAHPTTSGATPGSPGNAAGLNVVINLLIAWVQRKLSSGGSLASIVVTVIAFISVIMAGLGIFQFAQRYTLLWFVPISALAAYFTYRHFEKRWRAAAANTQVERKASAPRISRRAWYLIGGGCLAALIAAVVLLFILRFQPARDATASAIPSSGTPALGTSGTLAASAPTSASSSNPGSFHPDSSSGASAPTTPSLGASDTPALRPSGTPAPPSVVGHPSSSSPPLVTPKPSGEGGSVVSPLPSGPQALGSSGPPGASTPDSASAPTSPGAYALSGGRWLPLPANGGRIAQNSNQRQIMQTLVDYWADVRDVPEARNEPIATLTFEGSDTPPTVSGANLVFAFVGQLADVPADVLTKYPELKNYPLLELAPLTGAQGSPRTAPLILIAPGFIGFGPLRVDATVAQPSPNVTTLTVRRPLLPGRYALACGLRSYEVVIQ